MFILVRQKYDIMLFRIIIIFGTTYFLLKSNTVSVIKLNSDVLSFESWSDKIKNPGDFVNFRFRWVYKKIVYLIHYLLGLDRLTVPDY
jgi:hypothetical protein